MGAQRIPPDVAAAIEECWPDGVIEEVDTDESYFHGIHARLERDLRKIPGASLLWQTEPEDHRAYWNDDDEPPPFPPDFQSYRVFFLAPPGTEFQFETETESLEEPDPLDPGGELETVTYPGRGRYGCSVAISLAAPFAAVSFDDYAQFEDGSNFAPDRCNVAYSDETGQPVDTDAATREALGESAFAKLENLRARIVKVLAKYGVTVLEKAILNLPAPHLKSDSEVFLEGKKLTVGDAFFFRGV